MYKYNVGYKVIFTRVYVTTNTLHVGYKLPETINIDTERSVKGIIAHVYLTHEFLAFGLR